MSARVFKPIGLNETLSKHHKPEPTNRIRNPGIARVRRSLFGPINHADTQRFLEEELAKESLNSANKWQFNFAVGKPLEVTKEVRFVWEAVKPNITFAPVRNVAVVESDNEACYPRHLEMRKVEAELEMETAVITAPVDEQRGSSVGKAVVPVLAAAVKNTVQSRMTDFMQVRKRSADSAFANNKKTSSPPSKLKLSRSSNNLGS